MKKLSVILLSFILCISMFGCSNSAQEFIDTKATEATATSTTAVIEAEDESEAKNSPDTSEKDKSSSSSSNTGSRTTATEKSTSKTTSEKNPTLQTTSKATAEKKQTQQTDAKESTSKKQAATSATILCTVTIECKSILDNMDNLKAGHEAYVPSDGYMINSCSVTVANGSSVYDAVKSACSKQGVDINVTNSSYGKYIAGFNNIDEKDCGSQSGWLYNVNGIYPSKSCDKYILSNGDSVVFTYTCSYK